MELKSAVGVENGRVEYQCMTRWGAGDVQDGAMLWNLFLSVTPVYVPLIRLRYMTPERRTNYRELWNHHPSHSHYTRPTRRTHGQTAADRSHAHLLNCCQRAGSVPSAMITSALSRQGTTIDVILTVTVSHCPFVRCCTELIITFYGYGCWSLNRWTVRPSP